MLTVNKYTLSIEDKTIYYTEGAETFDLNAEGAEIDSLEGLLDFAWELYEQDNRFPAKALREFQSEIVNQINQ